MSATSDEAMRLLRECHAMLREMSAPQPVTATDADLDGPYGDPIIKAKDPRDWSGQTQVGKRLSECTAEYLEMVADRLDYFASREKDATKAGYNRKDAVRARGWAARVRAGRVHPQAAQAQDSARDGGFPDAAF